MKIFDNTNICNDFDKFMSNKMVVITHDGHKFVATLDDNYYYHPYFFEVKFSEKFSGYGENQKKAIDSLARNMSAKTYYLHDEMKRGWFGVLKDGPCHKFPSFITKK